MASAFEWVVNIGAIAGAIHAIVALRNRFRPKVPYDVAQKARAVLTDSQYIIDTSISTGGSQSHPWKIRDRSMECSEIVTQLQSIRPTLRGRKLRGHISTVVKSLNGIWASAPEPTHFYALGDGVPTPEERQREEINAKYAEAQRNYAETGRAAVEAALALLDKRTAKH